MKTLNHSKAIPNALVINVSDELIRSALDGCDGYKKIADSELHENKRLLVKCIREVDEFLAGMVSQ